MTDFGSRHKTSHQDGGGDEIDATGLVGRVDYVDRGDPLTYDWRESTLIEDDTWRNLDCSAIVPEGATAIHFQMVCYHTSAAKVARLRKNGNQQSYNALALYSQVSNIPIFKDAIVSCDSDRIVQYYFQTPAWAFIGITIRGWLI